MENRTRHQCPRQLGLFGLGRRHASCYSQSGRLAANHADFRIHRSNSTFAPPEATSVDLVLSNASLAALNWSLVNTSAWLNVSASNGTLPSASASNVTVSLISSATTNLPAGRYFASIGLTNLASGVVSSRIFTLVISSGDAPIALTGYNAAILAPNTATVAAPGATAFDMANNYCFYQAGLNGSTRGLPPDGVFTSQFDNKTVFQLKPYGSTNALMLGAIHPRPPR